MIEHICRFCTLSLFLPWWHKWQCNLFVYLSISLWNGKFRSLYAYLSWYSILIFSVPGSSPSTHLLNWSELLQFIRLKWSEVAQSSPTLCDPMDCSLRGSSVHGIFQARVLEWVAISFSKGSSRSRDRTRVSRIAGRRFTIWATGKPLLGWTAI